MPMLPNMNYMKHCKSGWMCHRTWLENVLDDSCGNECWDFSRHKLISFDQINIHISDKYIIRDIPTKTLNMSLTREPPL